MTKHSAIVSRQRDGRWPIDWIDALPLCRDSCRRWVIGLTWLGLAFVVFREYLGHGWSVLGWDLMLVSGLAMFVLALWLAGLAPARFRLCLAQLHDRGAIRLEEEPLEALSARSRIGPIAGRGSSPFSSPWPCSPPSPSSFGRSFRRRGLCWA
jgi:hypothetical protein